MLERKTVIFDMDGVLVNSEPIYFTVEQKLYKDLGLPVSKDEHDTFVGMSMQKIWRYLKKKYHLNEEVEDLISIHIEKMIEAIDETDDLKATPSVKSVIKMLKENGWGIAVATSTARRLAEKILQRIGILDDFDVIICGDEVKNGKPEPDIFLKACEFLNTIPENCIVIEDSTNGVSAAISAKMKCVGFKNLSSGIQDLSKADKIITHFDQLSIQECNRLL